jgi:wyosine [tRNA(Phe)-imidazoG37] synthetase (radical SAM superfamily)
MSESDRKKPGELEAAYRRHERRWKDNRYVYPVISRRSRGISIGINLNPGKECNFHCIYCQVDRGTDTSPRTVDPDRLSTELDAILNEERDGSLYEIAPFSLLPSCKRGVRDIAFSGNGEPTASSCFGEAVRIAVQARRYFELNDAKIVLITNASHLDEPSVRKALAVLDESNGEIWAKLDAGTEEYFRKVNRSGIPLDNILGNILRTASVRPIIIQSLWLRLQDAAPPSAEIEAYCNRLNDLISSGGRLKSLQLYTIARNTPEPSVSVLSDRELDRIADFVRERVRVPVEVFYGIV